MPKFNLKDIMTELLCPRILITLLGYLGIVIWSTYSVYGLNHTAFYAENGWLENAQVLTLSIACLVFFLPVVCQRRDDKLFLLFFSLLCLSFVLREVDVEKLKIPDIFILFGSGTGRNVMLATGFIAIFSWAVFNIKHYKKTLTSFGLSSVGILFVAAGLFLCIGDLFEKMSFVQHHVFFEEMSEFSGYVLILFAAFTCSKQCLTRHPNKPLGKQ